MKENSRLHHAGGRRVQDVLGKRRIVPRGILPSAAAGGITAIICALALSLVIASVLYKTTDPTKHLVPWAFSALYVSALFGGYAAARLNKGSALLCGACTGVILLTASLLVSLPLSHSMPSDYDVAAALSLRAALIACSLIGSFIGVSRKIDSSKSRKHKKR